MTPFDYWFDYIVRNGKFSKKVWVMEDVNHIRKAVFNAYYVELISNHEYELISNYGHGPVIRAIVLNIVYENGGGHGASFCEGGSTRWEEMADCISEVFKPTILPLNKGQK